MADQNTLPITPLAANGVPAAPGQSSYSPGQPLAGYTPTSDALAGIKDQLNQFQNDAFNSQTQSPQRASSSITDSITGEQGNYNTYLQQYNDLQARQKALAAPNYQDAFNALRTQQGVPGYEQDYL